MTFTDILAAVREAKAELARADSLAGSMAEVLIGRLRCLKTYEDRQVLKKLKAELQSFDARTGKWREEP
jgi:hypothetical protein